MLATLALFAVANQSTFQGQVVQRSEDDFDSRSFYSHKEVMADPNDLSKTVEATVSYHFSYRIHEEDEPDDYEVVRTVRVRPESPAKTFQMTNMRVGLEDRPGNQAAINALARTFVNAGIPTADAPNFERSLQAMRRETVEHLDPRPITVDPNENLRPGGWTVREYGYDVWVTDLHIRLMKTIQIPGRAPTTVPVGEEQVYYLWEYWTPVPKIRERFIPDPTQENKSSYMIPEEIGGVKFTDQYSDLTGIVYVAPPRLKPNESAIGTRNFIGTTNATNYIDRVFETLPRSKRDIFNLIKLTPNQATDLLNGTAAQGKDMNSLSLRYDPTAENAPHCGSEVYMPYGTLWVPDRSGYQTTMTTTPIRMRYDFDASMDGGEMQNNTARTHCLNNKLKEPEEGVRYFPFMSNDDVLHGLAELTNKSNFRGPWDQVRTWIYTDKVSFDEANERIFPGVTEGQYVGNLYDVFRLGGLTEADMKDKKFFDAKLLAGPTTPDKAFDWFAMQTGETAGKDVRRWIEGRPQEVQRMLKSPANDFEKNHVPRLIRQLLASLDLDARMGALNFLDKSTGAEAQLKDQVGDMRASIYSLDEKEAALAKKVAARYVTPTDTLLRAALRD